MLYLVPGQVGDVMRGPEIRAWELARVLQSAHAVTVLPLAVEKEPGAAPVRAPRRRIIAEALRSDVVIAAWLPPYLFALPHRPVLIADLYAPIENELLGGGQSSTDRRRARHVVARTHLQLRFADALLCANERQRTRLAEHLRRCRSNAPPIDVVRFGIASPPPPTTRRHLRDRHAAIAPDDVLILWWGSAWKWFDAPLAVEAVADLAKRRPEVKLVFSAGTPTTAEARRLDRAAEAQRLAADLGVLDRHVFFHADWVPYDQRHAVLADADIGLSLDRDAREAELAVRARYLDYLWARLPCVLSGGDVLSDELVSAGLAVRAQRGDRASVVAALEALVTDSARRASMRRGGQELAERSRWTTVAGPLLDRLDRIPTTRGGRPRAGWRTVAQAYFPAAVPAGNRRSV